MDTPRDINAQPDQSALTRMIYAFCGGTLFYWVLESTALVFFSRQRPVPWALARWGDYVTNGGFFTAMLIVAAVYGFKAEVFCWREESTKTVASWAKSVLL